MQKQSNWSIGIFSGPDPFTLRPFHSDMPSLDASHCGADQAKFVADPFLWPHEGRWYLFYEALIKDKGVICVSSSHDLRNWHYGGIALETPSHLSYPFIFALQGNVLMIPEDLASGGVYLYVAKKFPYQWVAVAKLLDGMHADATLFHHGQHWWMLTCPTPYGNDTLQLFYSKNLLSGWEPHPSGWIRQSDPRYARPSGRVFRHQEKLYRLTQNCEPHYGHSVNAFHIQQLDQTHYVEISDPIPILKPSGRGWNRDGMHHADLHQLRPDLWIASVDGQFTLTCRA
ncbi:glucosamine inositolphosphorylceramide transferase family protein [Magnetococcus marinus]|nr:hypothetical protein [Magnetococcus marinus]